MAREPKIGDKIADKKIRVAQDARDEAPPRPGIDADLIRELARLLDETGLSEIEFERDGARVRVARQLAAAMPAAVAVPPVAPSPAIAAASGEDSARHPGVLTSPMV